MAKVFILSGPTAAGKTQLALELAEQLGAGIVSADAMTVYRDLDVGTAKPPPEVLARIHHACVNVRDIDQEFSVADFCLAFDEACQQHSRVLVVGGTPFYLAALVRPLAEMPSADPEIRSRLEKLPDLHGVLAKVDPESASRLHPNDRVRLIRALEVYEITGKRLSELHSSAATRSPLNAETAWLDRDDLRERIQARLSEMSRHGYLEEVRGVLDAGWDPASKPLRSFAYRHLISHLQGEISHEEAIRRTERDSWRFARKQRTWARGMGWLPIHSEAAQELGRRALS